MNIKSIVAMAIAATLATSVAADTIRIGHATPEASPVHQALLFFKNELEQRSDGDFMVEIFPGGQLGGVREMTDLVQSGNITMTTGASVHLSSAVKELTVLDQFLLFETEEDARDLLDGEAGYQIGAAMEERGLKNMGFMELGFRSVTNSRGPLDSYESFEGLRMRSADNPIAIKAWRSVGAVPVPLAWGEIYSSLQQGLIDGQESALSSMVIERFFEVQDYVSLTGHNYWPELWMANLEWFESLDESQQTLVEEVAVETVELQRKLTAEANAETLDQLRAEGLQINELPPEDKARLGATMNAAIESDIRAKVGDDFYESFMDAVSK